MNHYTTILSSFARLQWILLLSSNFLCCQANSLGNQTDRIALLQFRTGISIDPFGIFDSWNDSRSFCNWYGITCSHRHQRVTSLNVAGQSLSGTISPYIGNLSFLKTFVLANNSFTGEIPQEVGYLFRLRFFNLSRNNLGGDIPSNLTRCTKLETVQFANNKLDGKIPEGIGYLVELKLLNFGQNFLTGKLPLSLGNLTLLSYFYVSYNKLTGEIPVEIGKLSSLTRFSIGVNSISGTIPEALFNISSLNAFSVPVNQIRGSIPYDIGLNLPSLLLFFIGGNRFFGSIPESFGNASKLEEIDLGNNNFVGQVPITLGNLKNLRTLELSNNGLGSRSANDLVFLTSLKNCTNLNTLSLSLNNFGGFLPTSLANLSSQLSELSLANNYFTGSIPSELIKLVNLTSLKIEDNFLTGSIPTELGMLFNLQALSLGNNRLSGQVPLSIGNLSHLYGLYLNENNLEGSFPSSIGNCQFLGVLDVSENKFSGTIPKEILGLPALTKSLDLSWNSLTGNLPTEVRNLKLNTLDISANNLSGELPTTIGECLSLENLYMQANFFQGLIPSSLTSLKGLQKLDLSQNNLTGEIPKDLQSLRFLSCLNLSFNDLEGEVPTGGVFTNASAVSLIGNRKLCGGVPELLLPKCPTKTTKMSPAFKLLIIIPCVSLSTFLMLTFLVCLWRKRYKKRPPFGTMSVGKLLNVSYKDLHQATDGFSPSNLIGSGGFSSVYKGFLDQLKRQVAVKVLNLQNMGASESFLAECKTLGNIRHRNLVKILTYCSSLDYKGNEFLALVYQFMENGSLENWLHPITNRRDAITSNYKGNEFLALVYQFEFGLHYLHDQCESSIIHCDLKPSNVLLDSDMVAHVSDFGLAKIISTINELSHSLISSIGIKGTVGYAPPEYGMGGAASKEGDVYSYGILVLEMFSGRRPTDEMFKEGLNLRDFISIAMPQRLDHVVDPVLFETESTGKATSRKDDNGAVEINLNMSFMKPKVQKCLLAVFEVGLACSAESPKDRMNTGDVNRQLHLIRNAFLDS